MHACSACNSKDMANFSIYLLEKMLHGGYTLPLSFYHAVPMHKQPCTVCHPFQCNSYVLSLKLVNHSNVELASYLTHEWFLRGVKKIST